MIEMFITISKYCYCWSWVESFNWNNSCLVVIITWTGRAGKGKMIVSKFREFFNKWLLICSQWWLHHQPLTFVITFTSRHQVTQQRGSSPFLPMFLIRWPLVVVVAGSVGCCCGHLDTLHSEYYIQILMGLYWVRVFAQCDWWWWWCPVGVITNISGQ